MRMHRLWPVLLVFLAVTVAALASETHAIAPEEPMAEETSSGVFTGSYAEALWTIVWFVLLLVVLWLLAWKPLLKGLQARQDHIQKQIDDAENARKESQQVLDDYRSKLSDAERQGREIINQRVKQAQIEAKEVENQTRLQVENIKLRGEADIEREKIDAEEKLWGQAGEIIQKLGQEVFGKTLTDEDNQRLIQQAIERLRQAHRPPSAGA
jgi:F-type H+-transporting ATPase subunit b